MMQRFRALLIGIPVEHREVDHPDKAMIACCDQPHIMADLHTQVTQRIINDLGFAGAEE